MSIQLRSDAVLQGRLIRFDQEKNCVVYDTGHRQVSWKNPTWRPGHKDLEIPSTKDFGEIRIASTRSWVRITLLDSSGKETGCYWQTDCRVFSGEKAANGAYNEPSVQVVPTELKLGAGISLGCSIHLEHARLAGTEIRADYTARIFKEGPDWMIQITFDWWGMSAKLRCADWLSGKATLQGEAWCDGNILDTGKILRIHCGETLPLNLAFSPSWSFKLTGQIGLVSGDSVQACEGLAACVATAAMPTSATSLFQRRSVVFIQAPAFKALKLEGLRAETEEGRVDGMDEASFGGLVSTNFESDKGVRQFSLIAYAIPSSQESSKPGPARWIYRSGLDAGDGTAWAVGLKSVCVSLALGANGEIEKLLLVGKIALSQPWVHFGQASVHLTVSHGSFCYKLENGASWHGHPEFLKRGVGGLSFKRGAVLLRTGGTLVAVPVEPAGANAGVWFAAPGHLPINHPEPKADVRVTWQAGRHGRMELLPGIDFAYARGADLLNLKFRTSGFQLSASEGRPFELLRHSPSDTLLVGIPPQSVCEETRAEAPPNRLSAFLKPEKDLPAPKYIMAGPSVLAFTTEQTGALRWSEEVLLDWLDDVGGGKGMLWKAKVSGPSLKDATDNAEDKEPDATELEIPCGFRLSGNQYMRWEGRREASQPEGRTELWHASLYTLQPPPSLNIQGTDQDNAPKTAYQSHDGAELKVRSLSFVDPGFASPVGKEDRSRIMDNTRRIQPVQAERLLLSPLGGWLDSRGDWDSYLEHWRHKATMGRDHYVKLVHRGHLLPFGHRAVVLTITERKVVPREDGSKEARLFTHNLIVVKEPVRSYVHPENEYTNPPPELAGILRRMPFGKVEILTDETSWLYLGPDTTEPPNGFWVRPLDNPAQYFRFKVRGTDRAGNTSTWEMPMCFVKGEGFEQQAGEAPNFAEYMQAIRPVLHDQNIQFSPSAFLPAERPEAHWNSSDWIPNLGRQTVAVLALPGETSPLQAQLGKTLFMCWMPKDASALAGLPDPRNPFLPVLAMADMGVAEVAHFCGQASVVLKYADTFVRCGLDPVENRNEVVLQRAPVSETGAPNASTPPSARTGGVVLPLPNIAGVSRKLGPVGGAPVDNALAGDPLKEVAGGHFNPASYFTDSATLLGGLKLTDILAEIPRTNSEGSFPVWTRRRDANGEALCLDWKTSSFKKPEGTPLVSFEFATNTSLEVHVTHQLNAGGAQTSSSVQGVLKNFSITFAGVIQVSFLRFEFLTTTGNKPVVHVELPATAVSFAGDLAFVQKLSSALCLDNFSDPPYLDVDGSGITCGYNVRIPTVAVGAFALQNMALDARMRLPFDGNPMSVRFALSERHNPFLVTVALFTGGGFFAIEVDSKGKKAVEGCLEAGGSAALNLGVAKGAACVMIGVYFAVNGDDGVRISGYYRVSGALVVLGIMSVNTEFYLAIEYDAKRNVVWGEGSLSVEVDIGFFSKSVTLSIRRELEGGSEDLNFRDLMPKEDWETYCAVLGLEN